MSQPKKTTTKFLLAILLILLSVLVWNHADKFALNPASLEPTTRIAQPTSRSNVYLGPPYSVAVLPFNCVRSGPGEALAGSQNVESEIIDPTWGPVFPFGFALSISDLLTANGGLHVTSPTSAFFFADSTSAYGALAEWLRVRYLLDGCFQPRQDSQDSLDIHAWLYDARAGEFLWSELFPASDQVVSNVINQVARRTTERVRMTAMDQTPMAPELTFESWENMITGWTLYRQSGEDNLLQAELAFQRVTEEKPDHAPAWVGLAHVYLHPQWPATDEVPGYEKAREAALRALELDSDMAGAHLVLSQIHRIHDWRFAASQEQAQLAIETLPGDADVLANASSAEFVMGRYEPAIEWLEKSISRNPVVLNKLLRLGLAYEFAGDEEQALISYRKLQGLKSDYPGVHAYRARVKLAQGKTESALKEAELEAHPFWQRYARIMALDALERFEESDPLLEEMILENSHDAAVQLAEVYALREEPDQAFIWLERAFEQRDGGVREILGNPFFQNLHEDSRWAGLLTRIGLLP